MTTGHTPGKGTPREARRFDSTYLDVDGTTMVHRDYAAHYFRWAFAHRFCKDKVVLDAGCGDTWPLGRVLQVHGNMGIRAEKYVGVDVSPKLSERRTKFYDLWPGCDISSGETQRRLIDQYGPFDVVCSFEVLEHMGEEDQHNYLAALRALVKPGAEGVVLLSTPTAQGKPARNHVREVTPDDIRYMFNVAGLEVVDRFGTFGDVVKLRAAASPEHRAVMEDLARFHSDDVLACFLAPLYPDASKNNVWLLRRA